MKATGTTDPALESWIPVAADSDFPIQNLPLGVFERGPGERHIGVRIGDRTIDLHALAQTGFLDDAGDRHLLTQPALNALFAAGRGVTHALRTRLSDLLRTGGNPALREANTDALFVDADSVTMCLPTVVGDYVDFYSSLEHATNLGRLFRPDSEPLLPNWRWIPIGYHGRSATLVVDDTAIVRPAGQRKPPDAAVPAFGPSTMLDIELEVGFITGTENAIGEPIPVESAMQSIAGLVLVNDWSARDIQAWEYQPLGPFLGKSFATTVSPWVVTLEALEPFRTRGPVQEPTPLDYLRIDAACAYDVHLAVELQTPHMRELGMPPHRISQTNFSGMYWNMAQQLAHATVNGARVRAGDLFASGTISGATPDSYGSLIELTWRGKNRLELPGGETRAFLEDGDEITLRGWCERPGARRIGFGTARGRIVAAARASGAATV